MKPPEKRCILHRRLGMQLAPAFLRPSRRGVLSSFQHLSPPFFLVPALPSSSLLLSSQSASSHLCILCPFLDRLTFLTSRLPAVPPPHLTRLAALLVTQQSGSSCSWQSEILKVSPRVPQPVSYSKVLKTLASLPQPQGLGERSRRACRVPQS